MPLPTKAIFTITASWDEEDLLQLRPTLTKQQVKKIFNLMRPLQHRVIQQGWEYLSYCIEEVVGTR